jgi:primase-polymerase (primpol)-like protein
MYETQRYLTFTAHVLGGRWALYERREALAAVHAQYLGAEPAAQRAPARTAPASMDDLAILDKAFRSRAAPRIARLWTGDTSDYASPSEADLALAVHLAFYTQDPGQVRRLLAMSGLGARDKWQRDDYALATIQRAIASRAGTYDPAWKGGV